MISVSTVKAMLSTVVYMWRVKNYAKIQVCKSYEQVHLLLDIIYMYKNLSSKNKTVNTKYFLPKLQTRQKRLCFRILSEKPGVAVDNELENDFLDC